METMHSRAKALVFGHRSSEDIATALRGRGLAAGETEIIESTDTAKALCFAIKGRSNFKHTMWLFAGEIDGDGYALVMISAAGSGPAILEGIAKEFGGYVCRCDDGLTPWTAVEPERRLSQEQIDTTVKVREAQARRADFISDWRPAAASSAPGLRRGSDVR